MTGWQPMETAPLDGTEILLWYENWCGDPLIVSGHWREDHGRDFDATFEHSYGYGDADMWMPLPDPPQSQSSQPARPSQVAR